MKELLKIETEKYSITEHLGAMGTPLITFDGDVPDAVVNMIVDARVLEMNGFEIELNDDGVIEFADTDIFLRFNGIEYDQVNKACNGFTARWSFRQARQNGELS